MWTSRDEQLLNIAIATVDPLSQRRWSRIAALVPGKTAQQCRAKFENQPAPVAAARAAPSANRKRHRNEEDEEEENAEEPPAQTENAGAEKPAEATEPS